MAHFRIADLKHPAGHQIPDKAKIVVVGAGMAGLYTTWRLINEKGYKPEEIVILEKLNRTGGRLDSDLVHFENAAGQQATVKEEEGGMRFTFDSMDNLMSLFMTLPQAESRGEGKLGILKDLVAEQVVPFPMNSNGNNRLFFRGVPFNQDEAQGTWPELYNLSYPEIDQTPSDIVNTVYNRILAANPEFTQRYPTAEDRKGPEYWQDFRLNCQWQGNKMKDWSLWNLFANMGYSNEAIQMIYQSSGFNGTFLSQMNGGVAYQLLKEFPANPEFRTLADGFSTLPNALAAQIGAGSIFLNTTVDGLDKEGEGYRVNYVTYDENGRPTAGNIYGDKVVLALPRLALETLFVRSNAFNLLEDAESAKLWNTLQTSSNQPLVKINLYYDKAWWGNEILIDKGAVAFGPNFSDLPVGSIYPFYSVDPALAAALEYQDYMEHAGKSIPPDIQEKVDEINASKYAKPAALTIYCDFMNVNYWLALQNNGPMFTSEMQEEQNQKDPQTIYAASQRVVDIATEYFKKVFNTTFVPQPLMTSARIWAGSPKIGKEASERFGFGVHQWALHAQDNETQQALIEPITNLYTCNEAYSDYQGWVEGSLRSANLVLEKWGLKPFSEVFEDKTKTTPEEAITKYYEVNSTRQIREYIDPDFPGYTASEVEKIRRIKRGSNGIQRTKHELRLTNYDL